MKDEEKAKGAGRSSSFILHPSSFRQNAGAEDADEREIAVAFGVIEAVANDEFIADFETDVIGGELPGALFAFCEQHANAEA